MEDSDVGRALFSLFGIAVLGLVVLAVRATPSLTWVAVLVGIPATILLLIQAVTGDDALLPYSSAFEAVLYFYAAGALIRQIIGGPRGDARRAVRGRRDLHPRRLGVRLHVHRLPGDRAGQLHGRGRRIEPTGPGWSSCS